MTKKEVESARHYALGKFGDAVQILVTQDSREALRVARAAEPLLLIDRRALPPAMRRRFTKLMTRLSKHPGWRAAFNLRGVHGNTATKWAQEIYSLESELRWIIDHGRK